MILLYIFIRFIAGYGTSVPQVVWAEDRIAETESVQ